MPEKKQILIIYLFLTVTTLLAFWQVGNNEFINFDDNVYVTMNRHVRSGITGEGLLWAFTTGEAANWHPLTWISHMLDVQIFGLNPHWHHLINLLFHLVNVLLLFFVLHRMTKAPWRSAFVAALFAFHPLHVESVAWVAERKDVLSTFFWMLTLVAYAHYAGKPRLKSFLAVAALLALGLMAKPMLVTLPFVLLLLDYWPLGRFEQKQPAEAIQKETNSPPAARRKKGKPGKQAPKIIVEMQKPPGNKSLWTLVCPLILEKAPLFVLTILSCAATYIAQKTGGAVAPTEVYTLGIRIGNVFSSYLGYITKTIWPNNLAVLYPHPGPLPLWQTLGTALFLVAVTFAVIRKARRFPFLPVGWLWFTGTLIPVIGIVQVGGQAMADRYAYIPSIGLFIMAAWGCPELVKKWSYGKEALAASSLLCLLCFFTLTWVQVGYWHDSITLTGHAVEVTVDNHHMYKLRALANNSLGNHEQAIEDYGKAVEINPNDADVFNDRGFTYNSIGKYTLAVEDFNRAIEMNPRFANAYNNRGTAYSAIGNYARAVEDFSRAIEIEPRHSLAYLNRALAYTVLNRRAQALADLDRAIETNSHYSEAYYRRGVAYQSQGNYKQAIDDFNKAIENNYFDKVEVFCNRGAAFGYLGEHAKAIEDFNRAIEINPEHAKAHFNRGVEYGQAGDHTRALQDFDRAIQIKPDFPEALYFRGVIHGIMGNEDQATEDMKKAARLGYEDAKKFLELQGE